MRRRARLHCMSTHSTHAMVCLPPVPHSRLARLRRPAAPACLPPLAGRLAPPAGISPCR